MKASILAVLALAGVVALTAPAVAGPGASMSDRDDGDRIVAVPEPDGAPTGERLQGRVLALDPERGGVLLATEAGMIALRADPEDIAELKVGDTIEVVMTDDDSTDLEPASFDLRV